MIYLPTELQKLIYSYDNTYKIKYDSIIKFIDTLPKILSYEKYFDRHTFTRTGKIDDSYKYTFLEPIEFYEITINDPDCKDAVLETTYYMNNEISYKKLLFQIPNIEGYKA